jgi:OOP family OmpA-OmpF porin
MKGVVYIWKTISRHRGIIITGSDSFIGPSGNAIKGGVKMRRFCIALVCAFVILAAAACFANERRVGIGVSGGAALLNGADDDEAGGFAERAELGPMASFILRRAITDHYSLGLNVGYGYNYDKDSKSYRTNLIPMDLNLIYTVAPEANATPYFSAGMGIVRWDSNHRPSGVRFEKQRDPAFSVGAGLDVFLNEYMALDINGKFRYMLTDDKDMVGRAKDLGLNSNDKYLWYFGVGLTWYPGKPKDTDGDGVPDRKDQCPDTPMGAIVDEVGCPKDSDGDGVYDGLDRCPDTPRGAIVDSRGCPKDSDGDGVYDGIDKCPDTPRGARVDENGCPKDSDGDGVYDGIDKCPDTPKGVEVDEMGCPKIPDLSEVENILFQFDKSDVIPTPNETLDMIVGILKPYPSAKVEIHGHTDSVGSEAYNMKLGMRRAEAVKKYLTDHGVNPDMLITKSMGETKPIATNDTKEGRQKNRRVEFKLVE